MRQGANPLALVSCGVAAAVAVALAGYFGWIALWVPTVEGDQTATTLDRIVVETIVVLIVVCFTYAAFGLIRFLRGRDVRWRVIAAVYLLGLLTIPLPGVAYLANLSGGRNLKLERSDHPVAAAL